MTREIYRTPIVVGKAAERLLLEIADNQNRAGSVDFSKEVEQAKKILNKAKLTPPKCLAPPPPKVSDPDEEQKQAR